MPGSGSSKFGISRGSKSNPSTGCVASLCAGKMWVVLEETNTEADISHLVDSVQDLGHLDEFMARGENLMPKPNLVDPIFSQDYQLLATYILHAIRLSV